MRLLLTYFNCSASSSVVVVWITATQRSCSILF